MDKFKLHAPYQPTGDQPQAIDLLSAGVEAGNRAQEWVPDSGILDFLTQRVTSAITVKGAEASYRVFYDLHEALPMDLIAGTLSSGFLLIFRGIFPPVLRSVWLIHHPSGMLSKTGPHLALWQPL